MHPVQSVDSQPPSGSCWTVVQQQPASVRCLLDNCAATASLRPVAVGQLYSNSQPQSGSCWTVVQLPASVRWLLDSCAETSSLRHVTVGQLSCNIRLRKLDALIDAAADHGIPSHPAHLQYFAQIDVF